MRGRLPARHLPPRTLKNIGVIPERDHRKLAISTAASPGSEAIALSTNGWAAPRTATPCAISVGAPARAGGTRRAIGLQRELGRSNGRLFVGPDAFPPAESAGDVVAHMASMKPEGSAPAVKILHHIDCCRASGCGSRIRISLPSPTRSTLRGGGEAWWWDVRVMVPSAEASDSPPRATRGAPGKSKSCSSPGCGSSSTAHAAAPAVMTVDSVWCTSARAISTTARLRPTTRSPSASRPRARQAP